MTSQFFSLSLPFSTEPLGSCHFKKIFIFIYLGVPVLVAACGIFSLPVARGLFNCGMQDLVP